MRELTDAETLKLFLFNASIDLGRTGTCNPIAAWLLSDEWTNPEWLNINPKIRGTVHNFTHEGIAWTNEVSGEIDRP